jgi:hypoxanthine phosphoribosyltransferase
VTINRNISELFTEEEIALRVKNLAAEIVHKAGDNFYIVSLLKGSFIFTSDLVREMHRLNFHPQLDFMTISSYGSGTKSSGAPIILRDVTSDLTGKNVLIVDDILESGRTLEQAKNHLLAKGAKSVMIAALLEKPGKIVTSIKADFVGFQSPDRFVVGYGLDYDGHFRGLPFIGALD